MAHFGEKEMSEDQDWRITPKQELAIQFKVKNLAKREANILLNIIEALYQSRPSSQNLQDNSLKIATDQASTQLGDN